MRENIGKYRGKRKDNGEWEYGWLVDVSAEDAHSPAMRIVVQCKNGIAYIPIRPETAGKYTGLKDKSVEVVEVWKGDLLESRYFPGTLEVDQITEGRNCGQWIVKQEDGGYQDLFEALTVDLYEVIGNIHEEKP